MEYRQLGKSAIEVSVVGLGCNNFGGNATNAASGTIYGALDLSQTRAVVNAAFDAGVNFYDTADVYGKGGSEIYLGNILADRRQRVVIGTKWGSGLENRSDLAWGGRAYIRQACEASLKRLDTDYIDLYQMHWRDPKTPMVETLAALDELVKEGKIRCIGSSHLAGWQVADADWTARTANLSRFVSAQNHYSLLERSAEVDLIPACERFDVGLLPYFPLESGLLTGKYRRGLPAPEGTRLADRKIGAHTYDCIENLIAFAEQRGLTLLDVAIGALAAQRAVASVLTGATKPEQIRANANAANWIPNTDDRKALSTILIDVGGHA